MAPRVGVAPRGLELDPRVAALELRAVWQAARRLPLSFWALTAYVFFEYVRPQSAYPVLDVLPWAWLSLIAAVAAAAIESNGARRRTLSDTGMALYTVALLASLLTAYDRPWGIELLDVYLNWVLVYLLLSATLNTQTRFVLFLMSWMLWNLKMTVFAVRSWASIGFAFRDWGIGGAPGWFQNSGEFGIEMCVVFPISLYFALGMRPSVTLPKFIALLILPVTAVMGSIASSSRGSLLGIAVVSLWILSRSKYKVRAFVGLLLAATLFYALIPAEQLQRVSNAGSDNTSLTRLTYWERGIDIANAHPFLGVGYSSWLRYYADHYPPPVQLPHNIFIECVSELGYTGLLVLLFLIGSAFWLNFRSRKLARRLGPAGFLSLQLARGLDGAMLGFLVSGSFVTVLYYPYLWVNLGLTTALHLTMRRTVRYRATPLPAGRSRAPTLVIRPAPVPLP